jgi:hypothetical protein
VLLDSNHPSADWTVKQSAKTVDPSFIFLLLLQGFGIWNWKKKRYGNFRRKDQGKKKLIERAY